MKDNADVGTGDLFAAQQFGLSLIGGEAKAESVIPFKKKAIVEKLDAPHEFYEEQLKLIEMEIEATFESVTAKRVRELMSKFESLIRSSERMHVHPEKRVTYWKMLNQLRQGDFADPNRRAGSIRKMKKDEHERKRQEKLAAERSASKPVDPFDRPRWWRNMPKWSELLGRDYTGIYQARKHPETPRVDAKMSSEEVREYLAEVKAHCEAGIHANSVLEVKNESLNDPYLLWFRVNKFDGFVCVDEMLGQNILSSEVIEGVKTFMVVRELKERVMRETAGFETDPDRLTDEELAAMGSDPQSDTLH